MNSPVSVLDPATLGFLARAITPEAKPLEMMTVDEARASMLASQSTSYGHRSLKIDTIRIAGVPARTVRPTTGSHAPAVVLYLHGGGWVLGSPETHAGIVQEIALRTQTAVVVPDYALAPEHPFPAALEQCYAVAQAIQQGSCLADLDGSRLAVVGDSAGGNLAAALALVAATRGDIGLRLQALVCPAMEPDPHTRSYAEFADGFGLTAWGMCWFWGHYAPDGAMRSDPRLSPLRVPQSLLAKAAPAWILTAGCDVLRDEGEMYGQRLWAAGNSATVLRFPGTIHNFPVIDELRDSSSAQAALGALSDALVKALGVSSEQAGSCAGRMDDR